MRQQDCSSRGEPVNQLHHHRRRVWTYLCILLAVLAVLASVRPAQATAGIRLVKDINLTASSSNSAYLTAVNSTLFFQADDGMHGQELWKSDSTEAGTTLVKDIFPDSSSNPTWLTAAGTKLFFAADDGVHGQELWKSDSTEAGTTMLTDIYNFPQLDYAGPSYLTTVGSTLFFATPGSLWKSDGTPAGTIRVKDFYSASAAAYLSRSVLKDSSFTASAGPLPPLPPPFIGSLIAVGSTLFFVEGRVEMGLVGLYKSDGTAVGTVGVKGPYKYPPGPTA